MRVYARIHICGAAVIFHVIKTYTMKISWVKRWRSAISRLIPTNLTDSGLIIGIRDLENHLIPVASFNIVKFPRRILVKM